MANTLSRGEKVAEGRSGGPHVLQVVGMRGLVIHKMFGQETSILDLEL